MPNFCASVLFVGVVLLKPLTASGLFPSLGRGEPWGRVWVRTACSGSPVFRLLHVGLALRFLSLRGALRYTARIGRVQEGVFTAWGSDHVLAVVLVCRCDLGVLPCFLPCTRLELKTPTTLAFFP